MDLPIRIHDHITDACRPNVLLVADHLPHRHRQVETLGEIENFLADARK
jgi:hypothetical protein